MSITLFEAVAGGRLEGRPLRLFVIVAAALLSPVLLFGYQDSTAAHNVAAKRALTQRNWKEAAAEYQRSLSLNPAQTDVQISLGIALWGASDRQGALEAFRKAIALEPTSARAHLNVAIAYRDLGQSEKALGEARTALKLKPAYEEAEIALGILLQQTGQPDKAILQYQQTLRRHPQSADAHNWLGVAYLQKSKLAEAEAEFRKAIKLNPRYLRAYNNLGSCLVQAGDIPGAIEVLKKGLGVAPDNPELRLNVAIAMRSAGNVAEALPVLYSLVKEHPEDANLMYQLSQTLRQHGDIEAAIGSLEKALEMNGEMREGYYALASMLKEQAAARRREFKRASTAKNEVTTLLRQADTDLSHGDLNRAKQALRSATEQDPENAEAHNLLGSALARSGDLTSALAELERSVALDSHLAAAQYNLGVALWYSRKRQEGISKLEESVRLDPAQPKIYSFLGMALREEGSLERAHQMFQRAVALNGDAPSPYFDLAVLYLEKNQLAAALGQFESGLNLNPQPGSIAELELAISELRKAIAKNTQNSEAQNTLGRLLGLAGADERQILAAFEEAVRLEPEYAEAYNNIGLVYTQSGTDDKAEKAFRTAARLRPDFADAHQNLGALLIISDAAEAVRELEKAVALQPQLLKAHYNLALAYDANGADGLQKEIAELQKLLAIEPKYPRAEFALGKALLKAGNAAEAVSHLQSAVARDQKSGEAYYQLALALSRVGRKQEGATAMAKSRELVAQSQREQTANLDLREGRALLETGGKADEALTRFTRVIHDNPEAPEGHYYLGLALKQKGETAKAAEAFRQALKLLPSYSEARQELASLEIPSRNSGQKEVIEAAIRDGKFEEAEKELHAFLGTSPKSPWGWYALGYTFYGEHKVGESIKALAQSLQLDVKNAEAHKVLGRNLMLIGRFDAAKVEFEQGARFDPKSAEMPYNLGKLYSIQDNWPLAKQCFQRAIALDTGFMEAYDGLGLALESLGEKSAAVAQYQKAIDLAEARHAKFSAAHVNMSALYNNMGDPKTALSFAERALQINPESDRALFQMAKAYEIESNTGSVIDSLNRAIAINPNSSSYFYLLATAYRRAGKLDESRQALEPFKKLSSLNNELEQKRLDWFKEEGNRAPIKSALGGAGSN
jgi:tetratricopeptide (TPR) repeat protein